MAVTCERCKSQSTIRVTVFGKPEDLCYPCAHNVVLDSCMRDAWKPGIDFSEAYTIAVRQRNQLMAGAPRDATAPQQHERKRVM